MTLVQTANPTATTGNTVATLTDTQPGNLILVFIGCTGVNDTVGVPTDDAGNTYVQLYSQANNATCRTYYCRNADSMSTVTGVFVGTTDTHSLIVREYSGINFSASVLDQTQTGTGTAATAVATSATAATKEPNELVVCSAVFVAASPGLTVGAGFGNFVSNNFGGTAAIFAVEDQIVAATGAQTGTMTGSPAGNFDCGIGTFASTSALNLGNTIKPLRAVGLSTGYASN